MSEPVARLDRERDVFLWGGRLAGDWIPDVVQRLVDKFDPLKIILFGSQARDDPGRDSDIDVLVVMPQVTDKHQIAVEMRRALRDVPAPIDVFATDPDEIARRGHLVGTLLRPALREGKVLYERPG